jgi:uncharacterized repeat protein (TIGR03803 family)
MRTSLRYGSLVLCGAALCLAHPLTAVAGTAQIVYNFTGGADGALPFSSLTPDGLGNFYGTTQGGGAQPYPDGYGTIFKLDSAGNLTTIYDFQGGALGETADNGVSLIRGRLYGSVLDGVAGGPGLSVLYSVNTDGSNYTVLHAMTGPEGGYLAGLLQPGPAGGEFGLGEGGGRYGHGTLFYLGAAGQFSAAHEFAGGTDGQSPNYLIEDSAGNLYGSTTHGGTCTTVKHGCGTIFKYAPATRTYSILYTFQNGADGAGPLLGAVDANGVLYGVSQQGGADRHGALFSLTPSGSAYSFSVLTPIISHYPQDQPYAPPVLSPTGALVGTTAYNGIYVYSSGQYKIEFNQIGVPYQSPVTIPNNAPDIFLATSLSGGTSTACAYGCGGHFLRQELTSPASTSPQVQTRGRRGKGRREAVLF